MSSWILETICPTCAQLIDPETCHCGDPVHGHPMETHSPVPMGCICGYADSDHTRYRICAPSRLFSTPVEDRRALLLEQFEEGRLLVLDLGDLCYKLTGRAIQTIRYTDGGMSIVTHSGGDTAREVTAGWSDILHLVPVTDDPAEEPAPDYSHEPAALEAEDLDHLFT